MFIRKIQFGIPITIIKGGIRPVRTDISKSPAGVLIIKSPRIPTVQTTPIITTNNEIKVALKDLKKRKKIIDVIINAKITKVEISLLILEAIFHLYLYLYKSAKLTMVLQG